MSRKQTIIAKAKELGAEFTKVRTKGEFIYFDKLVWTYVNKWQELKDFAKDQGFILH